MDGKGKIIWLGFRVPYYVVKLTCILSCCMFFTQVHEMNVQWRGYDCVSSLTIHKTFDKVYFWKSTLKHGSFNFGSFWCIVTPVCVKLRSKLYQFSHNGLQQGFWNFVMPWSRAIYKSTLPLMIIAVDVVRIREINLAQLQFLVSEWVNY